MLEKNFKVTKMFETTCLSHIESPDYTSDFKINIEENIEAIVPDNHEVTEVCPNCDNEITMIWNVAERGLKAFCPVCGNRLMLCSECPATTERGSACDYDSKTDTCNVTRLNFRHDNGR